MGTTNSTTYQDYGNPVLASFGGYIIQPYWLFVVELLFLQLLQRINSLIESLCKRKKKHIYITIEIALIGPKRTGVSPPKYSVLDFILSLISIGHFAFTCYKQSTCISSKNADEWKCYNAFGYRLHNYVLPSIVAVLVESIVQLVNTYRANKDPKNKNGSKKCQTLKWILLGLTVGVNSAIVLVFVPYFVSNTVPMLIAYCWFLLPILGGLVLVYAIFITIVINGITKCRDCGCVYCIKFFLSHCVVGLQVFGCLILAMAYNYSQYSYFGADYTSVIGYEAQTRDTILWYNSFMNNTQSIVDNVLTAL